MQDYILSCCSTADLSAEHFEKIQVKYICFHYEMDGKQYVDDLGKSIPFDTFYQRMVDGAETRTSQVNVEEYVTYFRLFLEQGKDVLHLALSSGISGSYNSARIAAEQLREEFPDRKLYVVDSLAASSGFGLIMQTLAEKREEGADIDTLHQWVLENRTKMHHWFFSTDLTFFVKGGRISKASGWFGTVLNICPLLNVDVNGKLIPRKKIRGKKAVINAIVEQMVECAEGGTNYNGRCYICQSACMEDARVVADLVEAKFPNLNGKVEINNIGTTIGSHTGPGTVALFFWGKERIE
ncbi:MAG: DegV family protein [Clostridia bacterium]|nr:DegV family protein [Clostridia bacterium]